MVTQEQLTSETAVRLQALRIANGFKHAKDFATAHNIPYTTYYQYESKQKPIIPKCLIQYGHLLGANIDWLLTGKGSPYIERDQQKEAVLSKVLYSRSNERSILASKAPVLITNAPLAVVDIDLMTRVLVSIFKLTEGCDTDSQCQELIDICYDIYNIAVSTTAVGEERDRLIELALAPLKRIKNVRGNQTF